MTRTTMTLWRALTRALAVAAMLTLGVAAQAQTQGAIPRTAGEILPSDLEKYLSGVEARISATASQAASQGLSIQSLATQLAGKQGRVNCTGPLRGAGAADPVCAPIAASDVTGLAAIARSGAASDLTGLTAAMVGLGNVNNTSDSSKPVSIAQQAAISAVSGKLPTTIYSKFGNVPSNLPLYAISLVEFGGKQKLLVVNSPSYGQVVIEAPFIRGFDANGIAVMAPPYLLTGLDLQYVNSTTLRLQPGTWVAGVPYRAFGFEAYFDFSPFTSGVGLNGTDKDYSASLDGLYYVYLLGDEWTPWNKTAVIISKDITTTAVRPTITANIPASSAYSHIRKLPLAIRVDQGKILPYTMSAGYPYPKLRYSGADTSTVTGTWTLISGASSTSEVITSLASKVFDNFRNIEVTLVVKSGGTAGYGCLRTPGVPGEGQCVWVSSTAGDERSRTFTIQVDSGRNLIYKTPSGGTINVFHSASDASEQS